MARCPTVALFGESERGGFKTPYFFRELPELVDVLGHPPPESEGLFFAVQALLYERPVLYFRVEAEGFSEGDYFWGLKYLENKESVQEVNALCMPGVGDPRILDATQGVCNLHCGFLIMTQKDLYDYLTA